MLLIRLMMMVSFDGFARKCGFELPGHGKITNRTCGKKIGHKICLNRQNHHASLDGMIHEGDVFDHKSIRHCKNYRCPKCFNWGAAAREADRIAQAVKTAEKFGLKAEHGMVSVPFYLYGKSEPVMRKACVAGLFARGFAGWKMIFHPLAYVSGHFVDGVWHLGEWVYRPHYHFLALLENEYSRCRHCRFYNAWGSKSVRGETRYGNHGGKMCLSCDGYESVTRRLFKEDKLIVKIFDERRSLFKTAHYILSHAGLKVGENHKYLAVGYGVMASRKLKVVYEKHKVMCPVCRIELVDGLYFGSNPAVLNFNEWSADFKRDGWYVMNEGLGEAWCKGTKADVG